MGSLISKIGQVFIWLMILILIYAFVEPSPLRQAIIGGTPLFVVAWIGLGIVQGICSLLFGILGYKCPFALTFEEAIVKRPISMGIMFMVANEQRKINNKFKD